MRKRKEQITIQEPPLEELKKKNSCFKRSCITGCGCIVIFFLLSLVFLKLFSSPREHQLTSVPSNFPKSIPLYDEESIDDISLVSAKERNSLIVGFTHFIKNILSPGIVALDDYMRAKAPDEDSTALPHTSEWRGFVEFMRDPVFENRDMVTITWSELPAQPKFIEEYYTTELEKQGYTTQKDVFPDGSIRLRFLNKNHNGSLVIQDSSDKDGTDYVRLRVDFFVN